MMAEAILVADDEAGVRESLAEVLRDAGYAVETAADERQAARPLGAGRYGREAGWPAVIDSSSFRTGYSITCLGSAPADTAPRRPRREQTASSAPRIAGP
jgi:CheY-like chemotaxis protein